MRIPQVVDDIASANELIRYATSGQLERVHRRWPRSSQAQIAHAAGFGKSREHAGAVLSAALSQGLTLAQLQQLDEIIGVLAPEPEGTGGLCSLVMRLPTEQRRDVENGERRRGRGRARDTSLTAHVPSSWTGAILKDPPSGEVGVLMQASALLSAFQTAGKVNMPLEDRIRDRYRVEMDGLVHKLILVAVGPPSSRNYDAQVLLGMLASYAFNDRMRHQLDHQLRRSPLGFRVWRAISKLVVQNADSRHTDELKAWVRQLIGAAETLREDSLYPGRSLDLELAISVPAAWSPPGTDWVGEALFNRARNAKATIRERGTAASGLWERALTEGRSDLDVTQAKLRDLIIEFRKPETRPDAAAGLRWIAATLEQTMDQGVAVCNLWPEVDEPWYRNVQSAARELDVLDLPDHMRTGAKRLFQHMLLQNAGVHRRQAIETVVTSCWIEPVATALEHLLENEKEESWLRIRALFALSFLQQPGLAEDTLTNCCLHAYANLGTDSETFVEPVRTRITEMHTALFAVGDCLGSAGIENEGANAREKLRPILTSLAEMQGAQAVALHRAARAAAYLLTVTAQPRAGKAKDLSQELLEKLSAHPDEVTARLSRWALGFRFGPDGGIRPLLDEAKSGNHM
jgi:hypothetical protein